MSPPMPVDEGSVIFNAAASRHISLSFIFSQKSLILLTDSYSSILLPKSALHLRRWWGSSRTYGGIASFTQDSVACGGCQWLSTRYNSFCAMHSTSPARERDKIGVEPRIDSFGVQWHLDGVIGVCLRCGKGLAKEI